MAHQTKQMMVKALLKSSPYLMKFPRREKKKEKKGKDNSLNREGKVAGRYRGYSGRKFGLGDATEHYCTYATAPVLPPHPSD